MIDQPDFKLTDLPPLYACDGAIDPIVPVKLFTPDANWTWYLMEYDGEDTAFGLVVGFDTELGYISMGELKALRGPLGLPLERDVYFKPTPITELPEYKKKWGNDGPYKGAA